MLLLVFYRGHTPGMVVPAHRVVKHFDVVEGIPTRVVTGKVRLAADSFALEQLKEILYHCIVLAVAAAAHAGNQILGLQKRQPVMARVHAALD